MLITNAIPIRGEALPAEYDVYIGEETEPSYTLELDTLKNIFSLNKRESTETPETFYSWEDVDEHLTKLGKIALGEEK